MENVFLDENELINIPGASQNILVKHISRFLYSSSFNSSSFTLHGSLDAKLVVSVGSSKMKLLINKKEILISFNFQTFDIKKKIT